MPTLDYTMEEILEDDPNFPSGYSGQNPWGGQAFDLTRNWFYWPMSGSGVGGIAITDLNTMQVMRTVTMAQMYAGTPYGIPAGSPPTQSIYDCACGNGTDLYILTAGDPTYSPAGEFCRFTRVDPITMKVTGEFYISRTFPPPINNVMQGGWQGGMVNTTATHTIVLYPVNGSLTAVGAETFDGAGMAPIGFGPTPMHYNYNPMYCPGKRYPDGSCDFIMMDPDSWTVPTSGDIDIWRINVSDSLVITNTKTGTLNILSLFTPAATSDNLFVGQIEYDPIHDTMIVTVPDTTSGTGGVNSAPSWLLSVNYDGTVNWSRYQPTIGGSVYSGAQHQLGAGTYMAGGSNDLHLYDTATGALLFTGSILVEGSPAGSFFHVWDSTRDAYWTYALSRGFVRIDFIPDPLATLTDAELVFQPGASFLDFTVEANRRKLIAVGGTPQFLGSRGEIPFAVQPTVYLTTLGPPTDFAQNNGGGGAFAPIGDINPASGPGCTPYYFTEAAGPAADPEWRLTVSDDGSRTWSRLVKPRSIGPLGHYKTRLRWLKMGAFRQRSIKLECTDPVRRNVVGVYIDLDQGMS